jgi:hypothetical protein
MQVQAVNDRLPAPHVFSFFMSLEMQMSPSDDTVSLNEENEKKIESCTEGRDFNCHGKFSRWKQEIK